MSIHTDQATVDRWTAAGSWVEFAESPADWTEPTPCETCEGTGLVDAMSSTGDAGCGDCKGSGKQRLAVQVPCDGELRPYSHAPGQWGLRCDGGCAGDSTTPASPGRVTVAWATQEWGPLPVVDRGQSGGCPDGCIYVAGVVVERWDGEIWYPLTLPPGVDPASLIGQWARGGRIEAI